MSLILKAILNAQALEEQRLIDCAMQIAANAPVSRKGILVVPTAHEGCLVDCTNVITSPAAPDGQWGPDTSLAGVKLLADTPPAGWLTYARYTATDASLAAAVAATLAGVSTKKVFAYALVRSSRRFTATLVGVSSATVYATISPLQASGWRLVPLAGTLTSSEAVKVRIVGITPGLGDTLDLVGVTVCYATDPSGPFSGDVADEPNFAYRWTRGRNASTTVRHTRNYDLVALAEAEAAINIAPLGVGLPARQQYLHQRFQSRGQSSAGSPDNYAPATWITGFKQQIGDLIRAENPTYSDGQTDVRVNNRAVTVLVAYSPSGGLYERIGQLIAQTLPCHLAFAGIGSLTAGGFLADVGRADVDVV